MGIFGRGRKNDAERGQPAPVDDDRDPGRNTDSRDTDGVTGDEVTGDDGSAELELEAADAVDEDETVNRARGPYDESEVDDEIERLDLGSLRFVPIDGMQLRLELDETQQTVLGAHALMGDSGVQLQAFAAPRTAGVWPDIRTEIADSIVAQGGTADVVRGPLGRELLTRMPQRGADGRTVFAPVRFIGIDGPRWFLRAVVSGPAASDEAAAAPLIDLVRSVVVVRGADAMPPREILPLRLPADLNPQPAGDDADADPQPEAGDQAPLRVDDLKPFERGPEITEVR
ncbi:MAG: DUF3710 domain-containing protein [Lapillicoccus sp.]